MSTPFSTAVPIERLALIPSEISPEHDGPGVRRPTEEGMTESFPIPGSTRHLTYEREPSGRLVRLTAGECVYLEDDTWGDNLAHVREVTLQNSLLRHVRTANDAWIEEYVWDDAGRPLRVDGVEVERDEQFRITRCGEWRYGYAGDDLVVIGAPAAMRHVTRGVDGRPVALRDGHGLVPIQYDSTDARDDVPSLPRSWNRDELGRLWTIRGPDGHIETTFLWDGFRCLGRIDGDAGEPLAAFFSLDPTWTPVRVITRDGMTRIPRDAFGESLLAHERIPGLFGGAVHGGFMYFRSRALDPLTGAFDRRDPWHGRDDDPRRADGFDGPLPVETPACGPYAVCQYDPVGRLDPTGEASKGFLVGMGFVYTLLDLTWSLQHNLAGWFGLELTVAWWISLFWGIGHAIGPSQEQNPLSRFFDYEGLYNDRTGVWALRRGFLGVERAFTYQHMVVSEAKTFQDLNKVNAILPSADFEPSLYGTILCAEPVDAPPALLRGNYDPALLGWSRSGGDARAVAPGSPTPRFPRGGLHLDATLEDVYVPVDCDLTELTPSGPPVDATVQEPALGTFVPYGTNIEKGLVVRLTDGTGAVDVKTVSEVDKKHETRTRGLRIRFDEPGHSVATNNVTLRGLKAASATDNNRSIVAGTTTRLDIAGTKVEYKNEDLLRFKQGGKVVGAGVIDSFEAQITLDSILGPGFSGPIELRVAVPAGKKTSGTLAGNVLTSTPRPDKGDEILLTGAGGPLAAIVTVEKSDTEVELDRAPAELVGFAGKADWQGLRNGTELGRSATLPAAAIVTYVPEAINTAPATGHVIVRDATTKKKVARTVRSRQYDALVTTRNIPGNTANPYDVEVLPLGKPTRDNLTLSLDPRIKLAAAAPINAKALQIVRLAGHAALTAGPNTAAATFSGAAATMGGANVNTLAPSQFVVVHSGATLERNVVQRITAALTLDRTITFDAVASIDVLMLDAGSPAYEATSISATEIQVNPSVAGVATQMPRFVKGGIVQTVFGGTTGQYMIDKVDGTVITLKEGPTGAAIAAGVNGTAQLFVPLGAPAPHMTWRIGRNGKPDGGANTNKIKVDVWSSVHVSAGTLVGLVSANETHVANITASAFTVTLQTPSALPAATAGDITSFAVDAFYAGTFVQSGADVTLLDTHGIPPPGPPSTDLLLVIPYAAAADAAKLTGTPMSSGTVLVPEDAEKYEVDRRKSLVYHELTHTKQAQLFGPLFMGYFPAWALEGILELATDVELPKFSQYVAAAIEEQGGQKFLRIDNAQGVEFEEGTKVQISQENVVTTVSLGTKDGTRFAIPANTEVVEGPAQIRRQVNESTGTTARDVIFNIINSLTLGGVLNYAVGTIWGGLGLGIAKLIHLLGHRVGKAGDELPATVVDSEHVRMTTDAGRRAVQGFNRIYLHKGDDTSDLLDVREINNDVITLADRTSFTGDVRVRPYGSDDPLFDVGGGLDYFDATVPDPAKPAQIQIKKKGDKELKLDPFDSVSINAGASSERTNVTSVSGDIVDLEDAPKTFGPNRELRIAFVDENDPMGSADSRFLSHFGLGWMRWLTDPYRQFQFGLDPKPGSAADIVARIGRYSFSSHAWSALIPGHLFLDDLFYQPNNGHLTGMEQQASNESGNTYSAISKIRMGFENDKGHGVKKCTVGEVAHFWHTPDWFGPNDRPFMATARGDLPGVNLTTELLMVLPEVGPEAAANVDVNKGATSTTPDGGMYLPDVFYPKPTIGNPNHSTSGGPPAGWVPGGRGIIKPKPGMELSIGSYIAFTRPGKHRVTVIDGIGSGQKSRAAHDKKAQTILFDVNVSDVTVEIAGTVIAQSTPPAEVKLLPSQKAIVSITPGNGEWALLARRPGNIVKPAADGLSLAAEKKIAGDDLVELSRVYKAPFPNAAGGGYADAVLSTHGVILPTDLHIPVRLFKVTLIDTFSFVDAAKKGAATVATVKPGTKVFAFIPSPVFRTLQTKTFTPVLAKNPAPAIKNLTPIPSDLTAFIGTGRVFEVEFKADDPPEEKVTIDFDAEVGAAAGTLVKGKIDYEPHFTLNAGSFDVQKTKDITLTSPVDLASASVIPPANGVKATLQPDNKSIKVEASGAAALGTRRILAVSKADAAKKALRTIRVIA